MSRKCSLPTFLKEVRKQQVFALIFSEYINPFLKRVGEANTVHRMESCWLRSIFLFQIKYQNQLTPGYLCRFQAKIFLCCIIERCGEHLLISLKTSPGHFNLNIVTFESCQSVNQQVIQITIPSLSELVSAQNSFGRQNVLTILGNNFIKLVNYKTRTSCIFFTSGEISCDQ